MVSGGAEIIVSIECMMFLQKADNRQDNRAMLVRCQTDPLPLVVIVPRTLSSRPSVGVSSGDRVLSAAFVNPLNISMGTGNTMVLFFSAAIEFKVCRYLLA